MEKKEYTAYLCATLRDVYSCSPRVLLKQVTDTDGKLFRDHVWVAYDKRLERIRPTDTKKDIKIKFKAYEKKYPSTDGGTKKGLVKLSYIERV